MSRAPIIVAALSALLLELAPSSLATSGPTPLDGAQFFIPIVKSIFSEPGDCGGVHTWDAGTNFQPVAVRPFLTGWTWTPMIGSGVDYTAVNGALVRVNVKIGVLDGLGDRYWLSLETDGKSCTPQATRPFTWTLVPVKNGVPLECAGNATMPSVGGNLLLSFPAGPPPHAPKNTSRPTIAWGQANFSTSCGQVTLIVSPGSWSGSQVLGYSYQWQVSTDGHSWRNIEDATSAKYTVPYCKYQDTVLQAVVQGSNAWGTASVSSAPVPMIPPLVGDLVYHGGAVMRKQSVHAIFWEPSKLPDGTKTHVSTTYNSLINRFLTDFRDSRLARIAAQYHAKRADGSWYAPGFAPFDANTMAWVDTDPYLKSGNQGVCVSTADVVAEIHKAIGKNHWPSDDPNAIFTVFLSSGECPSGLTGDDCGFHSTSDKSSPGPRVVYAVVPYPSPQSCSQYYTSTARTPKLTASAEPFTNGPNHDPYADAAISPLSHELMEAATDPSVGSGWTDTAPKPKEIGDRCAWWFGPYPYAFDSGNANLLVNGHPYLVQEEWSNARQACTI